MTSNSDRLKIESCLNQIFNNNNIHVGPLLSFSFTDVNFIFLNDIYIYYRGNPITITFDDKIMSVSSDSMFIEIKYSNIKDFIINTNEVK